MKKILKILMVLFLCFTITDTELLRNPIYIEAATTNEVKLSDSSLKITEGDSTQLKLNGAKGTIKWKSSKTSVAKVNSKGNVTAVEKGAATITATYKDKLFKCKVTVTMKILYSSADSLTIFETTKIIISTDLDTQIYGSSDNAGIANFKWGDWIDSNNCWLTITPKKKGITNIRITSDDSDQELVIPIKVVSENNYNDNDTLSAKQIYAKCKSATAQVTTDHKLGSGFYIAKGKLITNYHVIKDAIDIEVMNTDGNTYRVNEILGYDEKLDIAILSVSCTNNDVLPLNSHGLTTGEEVYAFGNPLGLTDTFTSGVIENIKRTIDSLPYIQSSAPISPGNSGGALVNAFGEIIGINSAGFTDAQNLNLAIPIHQIYSVNTYVPISLDDFAQQNLQNANTVGGITEDSTKSRYYDTAQTATLGYYINGTYDMTQANTDIADLYKFVITTSGYYELQVYDLSGKNGLYTSLITEKLEWVDLGVAPYNLKLDYNEKESLFYMYGYIPVGTYYLAVYDSIDGYVNSDVNYKAAIVAEE